MKKSEITTSFPIVDSFDNLEVGRTYTTYNYKMFKHLKFNRGEKQGFVRARVTKIQKMIERDEFYFDVCHVLVNLKKKAIDGNNRFTALMELGLPVNFEITAQPQFNVDNDSEILNNVSDYNSHNPSWGQKDAYTSALAFDEPAAVAIDSLKTWIENDHGIENTMFTPSRLIALATRYSAGLAGKAQVRRSYCNSDTANILSSPEFKKELDFILKVLKFVQVNNNTIREWFVIRNLMPMVWKKELSHRIVLSNMKKRGFKNMSAVDMKGVNVRVTEILKMGNV